jgi:NAD(P)-dependent dehydrogenase (short-subunit alcohol dehydrogenase family)
VFVVDISAERAGATAAAQASDRVSAHAADVTDAAAMRTLVEQVVAECGGVDVLVSNAGVFDACAGVHDTSIELWNRVVAINLSGAFNIIKPTAESMTARGSGRIVVIGSIAGQRSMPDGIAYCATKAALEGMVRRLAFDLGPHGVTANVVAPGVIRSNIRATSTEVLGELVPDTNVGVGTNAGLMDMLIPVRRAGQPSEVAALVAFLASDVAGYINGEVLHIDGGWMAS